MPNNSEMLEGCDPNEDGQVTQSAADIIAEYEKSVAALQTSSDDRRVAALQTSSDDRRHEGETTGLTPHTFPSTALRAAGAVPDVHPEIGSDPAMLYETPGVLPAGISELPLHKIQAIFQVIKEEARRILTLAPEELIAIMEAKGLLRIPVYAQHPRFHSLAALHLENYRTMDIAIEPTGKTVMHGYKHPDFSGLGIKIPEGELDRQFASAVGHELLHLVTLLGMHAYLRPPMESLTARLEKHVYGDRENALTSANAWNPSTFRGTTGLCPPPYSGIQYDDTNAMDVLYLTAWHATDALQAEQAWQIWTTLSRTAMDRGTMPTLDDIHAAMHQYAPEESASILQNPSFTVAEPGRHHFQFGTTTRDVLRVYALEIIPHSDFGTINAEGIRRDTAFTILGALSEADYSLHAVPGAPFTHVELDKPIRQVEEFRVETAIAALTKQLPAEMMEKVGNTMKVMVPGLPAETIRGLQRPANIIIEYVRKHLAATPEQIAKLTPELIASLLDDAHTGFCSMCEAMGISPKRSKIPMHVSRLGSSLRAFR